jgi:RNA polymerase sigma-70 factor (ECF subfamily)
MSKKKKSPDRELTEKEQWHAGYIYQQHYDTVYLHTYLLVGQVELAEDITHHVFTRLFAGNYSFNQETNTRALLIQMAHNACMDHFRHETVKRKHGSSIAGRWDTTLSAAEKERLQIEGAVFRHLHSYISSLPEKEKIIAIKSILEDLPNATVAGLLGEKTHVIKYKKKKIIHAFKKLVHQLIPDW